MLQVYFDESERESGVFCVGGFAFASKQAKKFTKEWSQLFADYPGGLHMRDLTHRRKSFRGIEQKEQERLIIEAVKIITRRMSAGFAISCNADEVKRLDPRVAGFGNAYSALLPSQHGCGRSFSQEHREC